MPTLNKQFLSKLSHPLNGFGKTLGPKKPVGQKPGNKSAAFTTGGIGVDSKSTSLSGSRDGPEQDEEKRSVGHNNKRKITDDDKEKQSVPADGADVVKPMSSTDPQIQYDAVTAVRKSLASDPNLVVDTIISCNILPELVNCLSSPNTALQFEATLSLTNIAARSSEHTQTVVQAGAVPHLLELLTSPDQKVRDVAVVAIGTIINDEQLLKDYAANLGVVASLLKCIQPDIPIKFSGAIARVILRLYRFEDTPPPPQALREILPALNDLVHHHDTRVLVKTLSALRWWTHCGKEQIQLVIDSGVLSKLVQLLEHRAVEVQGVVLGAVGNIIFAGTGDQVQALLNCDALSYFHNLLQQPNDKICTGAIFILSGVTIGNHSGVQAVIDAGLIPLIIYHLEKGEVRPMPMKAAAFAVSCMTVSGEREQVAQLIDCGVIPSFCNLLNHKESGFIKLALYGIQSILRKSVTQGGKHRVCAGIQKCGGLDKIQPLQAHENEEISMIACNTIENYFVEDVEEDSNLGQEVTGNASQSNPIKLT